MQLERREKLTKNPGLVASDSSKGKSSLLASFPALELKLKLRFCLEIGTKRRKGKGGEGREGENI